MVESIIAYSVGDTYTQSQISSLLDAKSPVSTTGLVLITSQTIGTAVSSVTVSNVFSSVYDAYKIIISGGVGSTNASISLRLGASTSTYNYIYFGVNNSGTSDIGRATSASSFAESGACNTSIISLNVDLVNPFLAKYTQITSPYLGAGTNGLIQIGWHGTASSYTDFTLTPGGTLTGGTIKVYGYK
jgi:hypothetical protein